MTRFSLKRNPNTSQFWDKEYEKQVLEKKIRSDPKLLEKFAPLFDKADSILDFGGGLGGNLKFLSDHLQNQHVNKFTVSSMFKILSQYGEFVHISPRSYSKRAGRLSTAYFYVEKKP